MAAVTGAAPARLEYDAAHWTRWQATEERVDDYLRGNARVYNATKNLLLDRLLGGADVSGWSVLDYGGGAGYTGLRYATRGARLTLVDAAAPALALAAKLAGRWGVSDRLTTIHAEHVPDALKGQSFDLVIVKDIVEHVPDDRALLEGIAACQDTGGRLLLSTHSRWSLNYLVEGSYRRWWCGERNWLGWDPTHVRFYSPRSLKRLLNATGYRVRRWAGLYILPYALPSWLTLLRCDLQWPWLAGADRLLGTTFPFNRLGWNVLLLAERVAR